MKINHLLQDKSYEIDNLNFFLPHAQLSLLEGIKYVCMQGSAKRAEDFARRLAKDILNIDSNFFQPINLFANSNYVAYRVGNILSLSHGMGGASILMLLHIITKAMYYANNFDVEYIRIGTSGGIGVTPGTVIVTKKSYTPDLIPGFRSFVLGKETIYEAAMDEELNKRILQAQPKEQNFKVLCGNSIATNDFYLGQARFDGMIKPQYDQKARDEYFAKIKKLNILNFEMESTALASFCKRADIPATMVAVTILNRMLGDQLTISEDILMEYSNHGQIVAINYLKTAR